MKKIYIALLLSAAINFQACNSSSSTNTVGIAKDSNSTKDSSKMTPSDTTGKTAKVLKVDKTASDYAVEVANGVMMEVRMGKLVEQKATKQSVKDFGAKMVEDHSKDVAMLKSIAAKKNITLPDSVGGKQEKKLNDLGKESGEKFDKDYVDFMVDDHKEDVKTAEDAIKNVKDPDLHSFALKSLPVLKGHLSMITKIQSELKK
jgi:putative membrane protein